MSMQSSEFEKNRVRITEIFYSLQGEARTVGVPTVFIRLTGCPRNCQYCDTTYAFKDGEWLDFNAVLKTVGEYDTRHVCVTGGEPLAQSACLNLLHLLCETGYEVSLETSGTFDVSKVDARVSKVMDIKTPGSGEQQSNIFENIDYLESHDQVKFVICDRNDYQWAKEIIIRYELVNTGSEILISPSNEQLEPQLLADWILEDRLPVRFQLQLHKLLWGDTPGR